MNADKIFIRYSKTESRTIHIPLATSYIKEYLKEYNPENRDSRLFPGRYNNLMNSLKRVSKRVLNKEITPTLMRHSSATYWCTKLSQASLNYRLGWKLSSRMPDVYIKKTGVLDEESVAMSEKKDIDILKEEKRQLQIQFNSMIAEIGEIKDIKRQLDAISPVMVQLMASKQFKDFKNKIMEKEIIN